MNNKTKPPSVIGYGRPPEASRFKPGQSGNPKGRPKRLPADVSEIMSAPMSVKENGKVRRMPSFEAAVRKLVTRALKERNLAACLEFLKLCDEYGAAPRPTIPAHQPVQTIPSSWNTDEWREMFDLYGPPPWPGDRSGLVG